MKSLIDYICESFNDKSNMICEANFFAEDEKIADLEPKMQDVRRFKLLVTRWDKLGEEDPIRGDEHYAGNNFDRIEKLFEDDEQHENERKAIKLAKSNFVNLYRMEDKSSKEYVKTAIKTYGAYIDAIYSWAKKFATSGKGRDKYVNTSFIATSFLGLGSWIINYGLDENIQNQLLGKLIKKFDKDMGKIRGVDGLSAFLELYDDQKVSMQKALDIETKTLKGMDELREERKKHKYTVLGGFGEGQGHIYVFDNSKFDSFEDILNSKPIIDDKNKHIGCFYLRWTGYSEDTLLRYVLNCNKGIPACTLCSSYYTFDNTDKNNSIPKFGFIDEIPNKIYSYSGYDHKFRYRGKFRKEDYGYGFFDSLWMQPGNEE